MVLGIDLGTSNTVASTLSRDGTPVIVPDANDKNLQSTPSVILLEGNRAYAGAFAQNLFELYPQKKMLAFFKRHFGSGLPVHTDEKGKSWHSEGLAALLLKKVLNDADMYIPEGFSKSVITVPAHYNDTQRKSVLEAARLANIDLSAILDEPVAAALYYGSDNRTVEDELTLVYDFGGGTFDLTLITQNNNHLHVIAKDGIEKLGGKEFDEIIAQYIMDGYKSAFKRDFPSQDPLSVNRLQKNAEEIKIKINNTDRALVREPLLFGKNAFEFRIFTEAYQRQALELIEKTGMTVQRCLRGMGLQLSDIQKIILIGGTSSSKLVHDYWLKKTANTATKVIYHQPLNSVAKGAALYAASLTNPDSGGGFVQSLHLKSVSTYNIGIQNPGSSTIEQLIHRNSPLPASAKKLYKIREGQAASFSITICQYWDESEPQELGSIRLDKGGKTGDFLLEMNIENKTNGTIGLKLKDADSGRDIRFTFNRKQSQHQYSYQEQLQLVNGIFLNNIIY